MDENPYESPQGPQEPGERPPASATLSWLYFLLVVLVTIAAGLAMAGANVGWVMRYEK